MKKALLLWLLILCCILCTACYTDSDPFPTAQELSLPQEPSAAATAVTEETAAPVISQPPATQAPAAPSATPEPLPEDAVDVSPNFNG